MLNKNKIRRQSGLAIMTVVLIIAIMVTLLGFMIESQHLFMRRITNQAVTEQAYQVALGSEIWGLKVLQRDADKAGEIDHPYEDWNALFVEGGVDIDQGKGTLSTKVVDLQGMFNLNNVLDVKGHQQFKNLLFILNLPTELADTLADWLDDDDKVRASGAESRDYSGLDPAYYIANTLLTSVGELKYIKGFTNEVIKELAPYVTVLPVSDAKINLNTAGFMQIMLLGKTPTSISQADAESFVSGIPEDGYQSVDDALASFTAASLIVDAAKLVSVKSDYFEVQSEAKYGNLTYRMHSKLKREGTDPIKVIGREHQLL